MIAQAIWILLAAGLLAAVPAIAAAEEFTARARLEPAASSVADAGGGVDVVLDLTQGVPWRVFTLDAPRRLVVDMRAVSFDGVEAGVLDRSDQVDGLRMGVFRPGWSRIVIDLSVPLGLETAGMETDPETGAARIALRLAPTDAETYAAAAGEPEDALWPRDPVPGPEVKTRQRGDRPLVVVLDPGHGGIDPGAQRDGYDEADLMLTFARELKEKLTLSGRYEVILTRNEDAFVPLQSRISIARAAGADVFLSLHADALAEGRATGSSVYTLSDRASDGAAALLAERHDRADLLAGVDLSDQDDQIAEVLMDLARTETMPRTDRLATKLIEGIRAAVGDLHKRARHHAGFSVLKAPEIPSALVELGFMSSPRDLKKLTDPAWRDRFAGGILAALDAWAAEDAAEARLLRQ